jgi:ribosomal protein S18 acetylase RimI-like enzyme
MQNKYSIRRALASDLPVIYIGELDSIRQNEPHIEVPWKDAMRVHLAQWMAALERMFIIELGSEAAGYCFWEVRGRAAMITSIYVLPDRRRNGLGRRLLDYCVTDVRAQGFDQLTLEVSPDGPARLLCEKAGFVHTHDVGNYRHYAYSIID